MRNDFNMTFVKQGVEINLWHQGNHNPLVMTNIAMGNRWRIEIDGLPINSMVMFHGELLNNQMVRLLVSRLLFMFTCPTHMSTNDMTCVQKTSC
jgi:hypothetical protein